jgi:hypothetical protein
MDVTVRCPHCRGLVHIKGERTQEGVQYHGVVKATGEMLRAGVSEKWVEYMREEDKLFGCGKPFILVRKSSVQYEAVPCRHEGEETRRERRNLCGDRSRGCHLF